MNQYIKTYFRETKTGLLEQHKWHILLFTISALAFLAWQNRFIQDDAFIAFRYAQNLADGKGLIWNIGEYVEGYTCFLWVLIMTIPFLVRLEPIVFSHVIGILFFCGSLFFTYNIARRIRDTLSFGVLCIILLGTNHSFSSYATGGLETSLQTLLLACAVYLSLEFLRDRKTKTLLVLSSIFGLAFFTRLDSAVFIVVIIFFLIATEWRQFRNKSAILKLTKALIIPLFVMISVWFVWKLWYYADVFPNSFYVKVGSFSLQKVEFGSMYVFNFFLYYLLLPFIIVFILAFKSWKTDFKIMMLGSLVAGWLLYVIKVGGDFMEFRFIIPILPMLCIVIFWAVIEIIRSKIIWLLSILIVLTGSVVIPKRGNIGKHGIESTGMLQEHVKEPKTGWIEIGKSLDNLFSGDTTTIIATSASGAIPFYTKLKCIDLLGLSDKWIAQNGNQHWGKPGHERVATVEYLISRNVNILIGHPFVVEIGDTLYSFRTSLAYILLRGMMGVQIPATSKLVEIPINSTHKLIVLCLIQNKFIDEAIVKYNWNVFPIGSLPRT
jgi:arabinofuranosyltransferase